MTSGDPRVASDSDGHQRGRHVAVIGGGITGLAAAHRLVSLNDNVRVTVFEATDRLGGLIHTESSDGWLMEFGPDAFITNKPGGVTLCEEIGFTDQLIPTDNTFRRSLVLRNGKPMPVPDGFMLMAPSNLQAIKDTPVLSEAGRERLLQEATIAAKRDDSDECLAGFVRRRFGEETLERLVQPLVGGIYTADPEKLSLKATLPRFLDMERDFGSVITATMAKQQSEGDARKATSGSGARYGLFTTPKRGMSSLVDAIEDAVLKSGRVTICKSTPVQSLSQRDDRAWQVAHPGQSAEPFDAIIMTLPTYKAAELLTGREAQELTTNLHQIPYASSAIVVTGHQLANFDHPLDAFGLVIPHAEGRRILATSFTSRKFPGRAPEGHILLRTFVGGAMQPEHLVHNDEEISEIVNEELQAIFGMKAGPQFSHVVRYNEAMPQYHVGHLDLVDKIEHSAAQLPRVFLAGNAYRGVGIPDSISSGREAAEQLLAEANQ